MEIEGDPILCPGSSVTIEGPQGFETYAWSNGAITDAITITEPGNFQLTVTDSDDCVGISSNVSVAGPSELSPEINVLGMEKICEGEEVELQALG